MEVVDPLRSGEASAAFIALTAFAIGALHDLEPGHSKTMVAAFIVAVRGTVVQAVVLGLSAAASHSLVVWLLALAALYYGNELIGEELEPWLIGLSGIIILGVGLWTGILVLRRQRRHKGRHNHHHGEGHDHHHGRHHDHSHGHDHADPTSLEAPGLDAHARAHAAEIGKHSKGNRATLGQVLVFGLSGGLIPCPAAITVLLLCLNAGQLSAGIGLVAAFRFGLAATLVAADLFAALGMRFVTSRPGTLSAFLDKAPLLSALLIGAIGSYMMISAWVHLSGH